MGAHPVLRCSFIQQQEAMQMSNMSVPVSIYLCQPRWVVMLWLLDVSGKMLRSSRSSSKLTLSQWCHSLSISPPSVSMTTQYQHDHPVSVWQPTVNIITQCQYGHPVSAWSPSVSLTTYCQYHHPVSVWPLIISMTTQCQSDNLLSIWQPSISLTTLYWFDNLRSVWPPSVKLATQCAADHPVNVSNCEELEHFTDDYSNLAIFLMLCVTHNPPPC